MEDNSLLVSDLLNVRLVKSHQTYIFYTVEDQRFALIRRGERGVVENAGKKFLPKNVSDGKSDS